MANGRVSIRGIGTLVMTEAAPKLSLEEDSISPPSYAIRLSESRDDDNDLSQLISASGKLSEKKKKKLNSKLEEQLNSYVNFKTFPIAGIGEIKMLDNGAASFIEDELFPNFQDDLQLLPKVELAPLLTPEIVNQESANQDSEVVTDPLSTTESKVTKQYKSYNYDESSSSLGYWIAGIGLIGLLLAWVLLRGCANDTNGSSDIVPSAAEQQDTTTEKQDYAYSHLMTPDIIESGCVIITGSFANPENVTRAISEVESRGYKPYSEKTDNLHRVGIYVPCYQKDLDSLLLSVQDEMQVAAWYLIPRYDPKDSE